MNILWYNTWSLPFITSNNHINKITNYILDNVIKYDIDIIALCEVFDHFTRYNYKYLITNALSDWNVIDNGKEKKWICQVSSGLLIFYRKENIDVLDIKNHIHNYSSMIDILSAKSIIGLYIYDKKNKNNKWLAFTHLQNANAGYKNYSIINTKKQFNELITKINEWNNENVEILCVGDFNLEPFNISKSFLEQYNLKCINPDVPTTSDKKIYDYLIASKNYEEHINLSLIDDLKNPSDHKLLIIETEPEQKTKNKIKINEYTTLSDYTKFYIPFLLFTFYYSTASFYSYYKPFFSIVFKK